MNSNLAVNCAFIFFVSFSALTNILRSVFVAYEKERCKPYVTCKHLLHSGDNQECGYYKYKRYFENNNYSCINCPGKSSISSREAEENLISGKIVISSIVRASLTCKEIMPYIAVLYTLIISLIE